MRWPKKLNPFWHFARRLRDQAIEEARQVAREEAERVVKELLDSTLQMLPEGLSPGD